jgi:acyl carrier protein
MAAELKFGFKIPDSNASCIRTVGDLVRLANAKAQSGCR